MPDIHRQVAAKLFRVTENEVTPQQREAAKQYQSLVRYSATWDQIQALVKRTKHVTNAIVQDR